MAPILSAFAPPEIVMDWHTLETIEVVARLDTNSCHGLSQTEAQARLKQDGPNELIERPAKQPWQILWEQLTDTMVLILIAAAIVSAVLEDFKEAIAILAIVIVSALLGFFQEYKAARAFAALKKLAVPSVRTCRNAQWQTLSARELVVGDVIQLETGSLVPADARLLDSMDLRVQESAFTGESEPVQKQVKAIPENAEAMLGDRLNMVYKGTMITYGRGRAVITATGMATELGQLADQMQLVVAEVTPLQRRLDRLGKQLAIAAVALVVVVFGLGLIQGESPQVMLLTAVSLAVAVVPESLAAVVTIALAIGAQQMLKQNALARKLSAVETLGSVTIICSDKTGTLTQNRMTVTVVDVAGQRLTQAEWRTAELASATALQLLMTGCALCNDVLLPSTATVTVKQMLGDPTEIALVVVAQELGLSKATLEPLLPRVAEQPFDADRKRMTTLHQIADIHHLAEINTGLDKLKGKTLIAFTKGSVGSVLALCTQVWRHGEAIPLTVTERDRIIATNNELAESGHRVLGIALRTLNQASLAIAEQDLIFIGVVGMIDPPRPEVKAAIETCLRAGIRPVMITGDQVLTAQHIAQNLGIMTQPDATMTGRQLAQLSPADFADQVSRIAIFARVAPAQKLEIVQALQNQGHVVAMTGDGVNDAPALKKANIGVAMGITGTDVAKEAADVVLLDDNFATIVAAVEQGRVIFDNIRKFIKYSMTGNASSLWIMTLAPLLSLPLPLLPLQILWINLLADGLLSLALSVEPAEFNTMRRPPYPPEANIFNRSMVRDIFWVGLLIGIAILLVGDRYWQQQYAEWQTMVFATLAFSRMSLALAMRSQRDLLWNLGLLSNWPMLAAVVLTFLLQLMVLYIPALQFFFKTSPLTLTDLAISIAVSTIGFWAVECQKGLMHHRQKS